MRSVVQSIGTTKPMHSLDTKPGLPPWVGTLPSPRMERWRQRLVNTTLIFSDVVLALFIWEIACLVRIWWAPVYLSMIAVLSIIPIVLIWIGLRAAQGLYPGYGLDQVEELRRQTYALVVALAIAAIFALAFQIGDAMSRFLLGVVFLGLLFLSPLARHLIKKWMTKHGVWGKRAIILGSGETGAHVEETLYKEWELGYRPIAVEDGRLATVREDGQLAAAKAGSGEMPQESFLAEAVELSREYRVDTVFLVVPHVQREYLARLTSLAGLHFRNVVIIPNLSGVTNSAVMARYFGGILGIEVRHNLLDPSVRRVKRTLDLAITVLGGLLILPLFLLLSGLVWLDSRGGSVFYRASRIGRDGKSFSCVKFRTMVPDAEAVLARMLEEDHEVREEYRKYHKLRNDSRMTRIGRFLRKTSLDELPQLWNVLQGEMSLVGPRPYLPRESAEIGVTQSEILRVSPGITGLWQIGGRNSTSFGERVQIDAHYVRNWSIWLDLVILARTVRSVLAGWGAC